MDVERRLIIMRRIAGAVGTAVLQILKWMLKIVLGALKLFLGLVRLVLLLFLSGSKSISFIRKNGNILRGGETMEVKGFFPAYRKNRRLVKYFFKFKKLL